MNTNTNTIIENQAFVEFDKVYNKVVDFINTHTTNFTKVEFEVNDDLAPETIQVFVSANFTDDDDFHMVLGEATLDFVYNRDFINTFDSTFVNVEKTEFIKDEENKCIFMTYIIPVEDNICK